MSGRRMTTSVFKAHGAKLRSLPARMLTAQKCPNGRNRTAMRNIVLVSNTPGAGQVVGEAKGGMDSSAPRVAG